MPAPQQRQFSPHCPLHVHVDAKHHQYPLTSWAYLWWSNSLHDSACWNLAVARCAEVVTGRWGSALWLQWPLFGSPGHAYVVVLGV